MFFPVEPDALSPLNTYVVPYEPPPVPMKTLMLNFRSTAITGMPGPGWSDYIPTYIDADLVLR